MSHLDLGSLTLSEKEPARLDSMPADILLLILSHLSTARSIAHLAGANKRLHDSISDYGWRSLVTRCFPSLSLPPAAEPATPGHWRRLARTLTTQSRKWDRRAFHINLLASDGSASDGSVTAVSLERKRLNASRPYRGGGQTIPPHIVVDAHSTFNGGTQEETVVWGAGPDIVQQLRSGSSRTQPETWRRLDGARADFWPGAGDVTALSVLKEGPYSGNLSALFVGRADGDLRLVSTEGKHGHTVSRFQPPQADANPQREIQGLHFEPHLRNLAAASKTSILLYPVDTNMDSTSDAAEEPLTRSGGGRVVSPSCTLDLGGALRARRAGPPIRTLKFTNSDTLAVASSGSTEPLRLFKLGQGAIEPIGPSAPQPPPPSTLLGGHQGTKSTVRDLLPVPSGQEHGGAGHLLLSAWDDGTVRLSDARAPSSYVSSYQDHFEPTTPLNCLAAYGRERFVGGSARGPVLKVFDFRWTKAYFHTDELPCSGKQPWPRTRSPTGACAPAGGGGGATRCDPAAPGGGATCRWHALSRHDFYRPNCNVYLRRECGSLGPVQSIAKASDLSPTVHAGLSGWLACVNLRGETEGAAAGGGDRGGSPSA